MRTIPSLLETQTGPLAFEQLHTAIGATGLIRVLEGATPVTLFAPNNEAFHQLHQGAIYDLLKNITLLRKLLEFHIVPLKLTRAMIMQLATSPTVVPQAVQATMNTGQSIELPTISGHALLITIDEGLQVQGTDMLEPEIEADNGVIHSVKQILWPPHITEASFGERSALNISH
jgi:uncharacterized surface protein with fasciclin (FAS1) repeats